jgi:hypothetical protein
MSPAMHLRKPKIKIFLIFPKNAAISAIFQCSNAMRLKGDAVRKKASQGQ